MAPEPRIPEPPTTSSGISLSDLPQTGALELNPGVSTDGIVGTWYPATRVLTDQLTHLVALWPLERGRITRVLYCRPDWVDQPRAVRVSPERRIKTGSFPADDNHCVTLTTLDTRRHILTVTHLAAPSDRDRLERTSRPGIARATAS